MSHTPGPWKFDGSHVTDRTNTVISIEGIAQPHGVTADDDPAWANARLIAAAPDLLAACHKICKAIAFGVESTLAKELCDGYDAVRAAIAKAEGR